MQYVATKTFVFAGRSVQPGDPLPEVEGWGRAQIERRLRSGRIAEVPDGHKLVRHHGGKWRAVPVGALQAIGAPPEVVESPAPVQPAPAGEAQQVQDMPSPASEVPRAPAGIQAKKHKKR